MVRLVALVSLLGLPALAAPDAGAKPRIAVLYFDPQTPDADLQSFTKGLASLLITDFIENPGLVVLERERLEDAIKELKLGETRFADKSKFAKIGQLLGVDYLITGTLSCYKTQCHLSSHVFSVATSVSSAGARAKLDEADVFASETAIMNDLSKKLIALGAIAEAPVLPEKTHKLPLKTAVAYSRALDAKDKKDPATATRLLGEVVKDQPNFKLAQLDLLSLTK